jgi:hypothetical protein
LSSVCIDSINSPFLPSIPPGFLYHLLRDRIERHHFVYAAVPYRLLRHTEDDSGFFILGDIGRVAS